MNRNQVFGIYLNNSKLSSLLSINQGILMRINQSKVKNKKQA